MHAFDVMLATKKYIETLDLSKINKQATTKDPSFLTLGIIERHMYISLTAAALSQGAPSELVDDTISCLSKRVCVIIFVVLLFISKFTFRLGLTFQLLLRNTKLCWDH